MTTKCISLVLLACLVGSVCATSAGNWQLKTNTHGCPTGSVFVNVTQDGETPRCEACPCVNASECPDVVMDKNWTDSVSCSALVEDDTDESDTDFDTEIDSESETSISTECQNLANAVVDQCDLEEDCWDNTPTQTCCAAVRNVNRECPSVLSQTVEPPSGSEECPLTLESVEELLDVCSNVRIEAQASLSNVTLATFNETARRGFRRGVVTRLNVTEDRFRFTRIEESSNKAVRLLVSFVILLPAESAPEAVSDVNKKLQDEPEELAQAINQGLQAEGSSLTISEVTVEVKEVFNPSDEPSDDDDDDDDDDGLSTAAYVGIVVGSALVILGAGVLAVMSIRSQKEQGEEEGAAVELADQDKYQDADLEQQGERSLLREEAGPDPEMEVDQEPE